jgi:mRNA interferase MazF
MVIRQGEVYWIELGEPIGSGPGYRHPYVVVQNDVFNESRLNTVIVCLLTSSLRRASAPGNVILRAGEANLPKQSVVNVSQLFTIDKSLLMERVGALTPARTREIIDGVKLFLEPRKLDVIY